MAPLTGNCRRGAGQLLDDRDGSDTAVQSPHPIDSSVERLTIALPRSVTASGVAREQLKTWLESAGVPRQKIDDILLCTSELVTNAVTHAASAPTLSAALVDSGCVAIEVADESARHPVKRTGGADGGFGIRVVDAIATRWGATATSEGKIVWALFDVTP